MRTAKEIACTVVDSDRTWYSIEKAMKEYATEIIDRCTEVAMAEDIINGTAVIKNEPYNAVWRQIHKVHHEIK